MKIFRFPVPDHPEKIPPVLACKDFSPDASGTRIGHACRDHYTAWKEAGKGGDYSCINLKNKVPGYCWKASFLYPRKYSSEYKQIHFHQGIDMAGGCYGAEVVSVTGGVVTFVTDQEYKLGCGGYGRMVAIHDDLGTLFHFLYSHLKAGVLVKENQRITPGQPIGYVGNSGTAKDESGKRIIVDYAPSGAHLHFEVSKSEYPKPGGVETKLSSWREGGDIVRLDPLAVLEQLGPYGSLEVYEPRGRQLSADAATLLHKTVESSSTGGFFPLGANNLWHGGVHLPAVRGTKLVAPFDADIVALRLDPSPDPARMAYGSPNFILLRHEIRPAAFARLQAEAGEAPPTPDVKPESKKSGIGKGRTNPPEWVTYVKQKLHDKRRAQGDPYYLPPPPYDETVDDLFLSAIDTFQLDMKPKPSWAPDSAISIGKATWKALHDGDNPDPPAIAPADDPEDAEPQHDPKRTLYTIVMHLAAMPVTEALAKLEAKDAQGTTPPKCWLRNVKLDPTPQEAAQAAERKKQIEAQREEDEVEAAQGMDAAVGRKKANQDADVTWVKQRLIRHRDDAGKPYFEGAIDGTFTDALEAAIERFQAERVDYFRSSGRAADGEISPTGQTKRALQALASDSAGGAGASTPIDPSFLNRVEERDANGDGKVLSGLSIPVRSGEPLWFSDVASGYQGDEPVETEAIHWEIFSEYRLIPSWKDEIVDTNEDATADVGAQVFALVEEGSPPNQQDGFWLLGELREFYGSERAQFLRRTPCKFRGEWAMDLDAAIASLTAKFSSAGYELDADKLRDDVTPYQWWNQAQDVLPSSPHVWHYNPVEFAGFYAEILAELAPPEPEPPPDPNKFATLVIEVLDRHGNPAPGFPVGLKGESIAFIAVPTSLATEDDAGGKAVFTNLPIGPYTAQVVGSSHPAQHVVVMPKVQNRFVLHTEQEGPPPPDGKLTVITRDYGMTSVNGAVVTVSQAGKGVIASAKSPTGKKRGEVVFPALPFGDYVIEAQLPDQELASEPVELTLGKAHVETLKFPPPWGKLLVKAVYAATDAPARGEAVSVFVKEGGSKTMVAKAVTDERGEALVTVRIGTHDVAVGEASKTKQIWINKAKRGPDGNAQPQVRTFKVEHAKNPATLQVGLIDPTGPRVGALIRVKRRGSTAYRGYTNSDGIVIIEGMTPGQYTVSTPDAEPMEIDLTEGIYLPIFLTVGG